MEFKFNVTGKDRKELVTAVSKITGWEPAYKGAPTFAYAVGNYVIDKNGTLTCADENDKVYDLVEKLCKDEGFYCENEIEPEGAFTISQPNDFTDAEFENLEKLVKGKETLIKASLQADTLDIQRTDETISFPWFMDDASDEEKDAYRLFISALCKTAKEQKRVNLKPEKEVTNMKFEMRCFLLKLGFIGDEYKSARKILLSGLNGSSAYLNK